ncbi:zinc ribbon domain-containing protein [Streptosporangium canum]|uniref:zinc ribbon domain-containing protein n=1 Tax=Streptosporangium canum TaxID=324952 RepID=UPI0033BD448B
MSYKAESAGRELIAVNPAHTSRACARCGHRARENRRTQAARPAGDPPPWSRSPAPGARRHFLPGRGRTYP